MKTLAVFSLSCFFLFFAGVSGWAQVLVPDCDTSVYGLSLARLQEEMHCLNKALESQAESNENRLGDILELQDKLKQTEHRLYTAELGLQTAESRIEMLENIITRMQSPVVATRKAAATKPKAPASKPKAPVNQAKPVDSPKDQ